MVEIIPHTLPIPKYSDPKIYVSDLTKASGSSFYLPMIFLQKHRREAMLALYAYCRETDDVADEIEDDRLSKKLIEAWRHEIESLFSGVPNHPVTKALQEPIVSFNLEKKPFLEILDGFEMDRSGQMLRPSLDQLEKYCHRVASCVGLISVKIFGYNSPEVPGFAEHLGQAFQLTNILRDVSEDAERGRIYLPFELLKKENLEMVPPSEIATAQGVERVCREVGMMARQHFESAEKILPRSEKKNMRPALLMRSVYEAYLNEIEKHEFQIGKINNIRFSKKKKIGLLFSGLLSSL